MNRWRAVSFSLLLLAAAARADSVRQLRLPTNDLVYSAAARQIYASVPGRAGAGGNSIAVIDPAAGVLARSVFVGSEPGKLALSDDGRYLYVALDGAAAVQRLSLPDLTLGSRFSLRSDPLAGFEQVRDMAVLPGRPETVAVITSYPSGYGSGSLTIYDRGARLPLALSGPGSPVTLAAPPAATRLYGLTGYPGPAIQSLTVDAAGVSVARSVPTSMLTGYYQLEGGRLYTSTGLIFDPELGTVVGQFPLERQYSNPVGVADAAVGRAFFLNQEGATPRLLAFGLKSLLMVGSTPVPGYPRSGWISGFVPRLVRYGKDGIAFRTEEGQLFLVRTDLVPTGVLTVMVEPAAVQAGTPARGRIVLKQPAPKGGSVVVLTSELPEAVKLPAQVVVPAGATSVSFPVTTVAVAKATAVPIRANLAGQVASSGLELLLPPGPVERLEDSATVRRVSLPTRDLVYDRRSGRIYASIPSRIGGIGGSVAVIDPRSGVLVSFIPVGPEPGKLALSDDGRYLYVALDGAAAVRRIDLSTQTAGPSFSLGAHPDRGAYLVEDMEVAPGEPDVVAISRYNAGFHPRHAGVVVFDRGMPRVRQTSRTVSNNKIVFGAKADRLYGSDSENNGYTFSRMTVDASGVTLLDTTGNLSLGLYPGVDIRFDSGLIFTSAGAIIDPEAREKLGAFNVSDGSLVAPEVRAGRVFFLNPWGTTRKDVVVFNARTLGLLGRVAIEDVFGDASSLQRWGEDGLAFRTGQGLYVTPNDRIMLVRLPLVSGKKGADLAVTVAAPTAGSRLGQTLTFSITVTNRGPEAAPGVTLTAPLPPGVAFVSANASRGSCAVNQRVVTCRLGDLAEDESVAVSLVLLPRQAGVVMATVTVAGSGSDPDASNNRASGSVTVTRG